MLCLWLHLCASHSQHSSEYTDAPYYSECTANDLEKLYTWSYQSLHKEQVRYTNHNMDRQQKLVLKLRAGQVFRPGTPIDKFSLFAGRQNQVEEIVHAINQTGQHVVIFGERGVGKTSLTKVLVELLMEAGIDVISPESVNCDTTDTFPTIWNKVFRELMAMLKVRNRESAFQIHLDQSEVYSDTPSDVRYALGLLPNPTVIVIDEFDRIADEETTTTFADLIKDLSDHSTPSTLLLVGVADSVDELIREHRSVERALIQVHLPRMSAVELREVLSKGIAELGMTFINEAANQIVQLSAGLPHYTHTLALYATEHAIENERNDVIALDVSEAIKKTVDKPGSLLSAYETATQSSRKTLYEQVLLACAMAPKSDLGFFSAASVKTPLERILGKQYDIPTFAAHLDAFCSDARGHVLSKTGGPRQYRFRFVNPLLQPYIIIRAIAKGFLTDDLIYTGE